MDSWPNVTYIHVGMYLLFSKSPYTEQVAKEAYASYLKGKHKNFNMSDSVLFISTDHPYLGASPDGLVSCECCGAGGCEIKVLICLMVKFILLPMT